MLLQVPGVTPGFPNAHDVTGTPHVEVRTSESEHVYWIMDLEWTTVFFYHVQKTFLEAQGMQITSLDPNLDRGPSA